MTKTELDEATKEALNELSGEKGNDRLYAYFHEIDWYGVDAVAHSHLMRQAAKVAHGKIELEQFVKKYELSFSGIPLRGFNGILEPMRADGLFIPEGKTNINFFSLDYLNYLVEFTGDGKAHCPEYALNLVDRLWKPGDLEDPQIISDGIKFARAVWDRSISDFEKTATNLPQHVIGLSRKLIGHYHEIIYGE